jgi:transmembrane sensor
VAVNRSSIPEIEEDIDRAAADWFARKRSGEMTLGQAQELEAWLAADPAHRAALDAVETMWAGADSVRSDPVVLALREAALKARRPSWRLITGGAIAACLALLVAGPMLNDGSGLMPGPRTFRTEAGQTSTITLPDGSKVTLDADTVLRADETARTRKLELLQGRAFFRVAKDPSRPFVVTARDKTVTALGTAFDVRLTGAQVQVTLVEGKVRVEAPVPVAGAAPLAPVRKQSTEMTAGSQLVAPPGGSWTLAKVDTNAEVSWASGQLVFAGRSLAQVAEELNAHSDKKIVITDPAVGRAMISGSFDAGDVEGFVRAVEAYRLAQVEVESDSRVELVAPE